MNTELIVKRKLPVKMIWYKLEWEDSNVKLLYIIIIFIDLYFKWSHGRKASLQIIRPVLCPNSITTDSNLR